mmetsp:Transcript_21868/g.52030  ORF Transcript_21868/g.52030 Transcript_21868/m.52030 type:complete len:142 (+) Transcript_21868:387-812(+)
MHIRASTKRSWNSFNRTWICFGHSDSGAEEENERNQTLEALSFWCLCVLVEDQDDGATSEKTPPIAIGAITVVVAHFGVEDVAGEITIRWRLQTMLPRKEKWRIVAVVAIAAGPFTQNLEAAIVGDISGDRMHVRQTVEVG